MYEVISDARKELSTLKGFLDKIDRFLKDAPDGCLKFQNRNGNIYYYRQVALCNNRNGV